MQPSFMQLLLRLTFTEIAVVMTIYWLLFFRSYNYLEHGPYFAVVFRANVHFRRVLVICPVLRLHSIRE